MSFAAGLTDEGAGWLVRFVHPAFAYLKIAGFVVLQVMLAVLIVTVLVVATGSFRNAYTEDFGR